MKKKKKKKEKNDFYIYKFCTAFKHLFWNKN